MQLFSIEQQKSQPLEAHAAAFSTVKVRARGRGRALCCGSSQQPAASSRQPAASSRHSSQQQAQQ
jgi:hypothetical protein